jgi:PAS domain-containing protein
MTVRSLRRASRSSLPGEFHTDCSGRVRVLQTSKFPFRLPGGGEGLIGVAVDNSELRETETRLCQSEAEFRALFDLAAIGMAQADPQTGRLLRVNQKLCSQGNPLERVQH